MKEGGGVSKRRVLFVAHSFPPDGGPGVQRSLKFVKYLPKFGWEPLVVTAKTEAGYVQDPTLIDNVPADTIVRRLPGGFSIPQLYRAAKRYRLEKAVVLANVLLQVPDPVRFWAQSVRGQVLNIVREERPEVIYTTSGPYGAHLLGLWLRRQTGLPWLADFRDPWSKNLLTPYLPGYRRYNAHLERRVLAAADRIICVSEPWLNDLRQNLGRDEAKFIVLPNGYDEDDVNPLPGPKSNDRFTILHYGTFYRNRQPEPVIDAVGRLMRSGRIPVEKIRVTFVGRNSKSAVPHDAPFEPIDYVPYQELDGHRSMADVLLLILDTSRANIGNHSGKLFEYIASNRPILGIVPPGGVAEELIRRTRTGLTVHGDPAAIAEAIETLYLEWKDRTATWNPDWDVIRQYTRKRITERLAQEFDKMVEVGAGMS